MSDVQQLIDLALDPSLERWQPDNTALWFSAFKGATVSFENSIDRAFLAGRLSQSLGFAFAGAYQSAIESLFGRQGDLLASLCVTEAEGNHPRAIHTRLFEQNGQLLLSGNKRFISGAKDAGMMFVACRDERRGKGFDAQGRPILKVVQVPTNISGVDIQPMPELDFIPEVSHGCVGLDNVKLSSEQVLAGDGYLDYLKAFRSHEDLHVLASIVSFRLAEAVAGAWGSEVLEQHLALILAIRQLNALPLDSAAAHVSISAVRAQLTSLIQNTDELFQSTRSEVYRCWQRDKRLLQVAKKAHELRTARAWQHYA